MILLPILLLMISIKDYLVKCVLSRLNYFVILLNLLLLMVWRLNLSHFFPNFTSSSSLIETLPANDDSLPLNYNSTRPHVRTYKFKKGYYFLVLKVLDMVLILILEKIQYLPGQISVVRAFPPQFVPQSGYNVIYNVIVRVMITFF